MTTKPPSAVKAASEQALEKIAYAAVADIPLAEPRDRDRLGYSIWRWMTQERDSLEHAIHNAGVRLQVSEEEALRLIREKLQQLGVKA